MAAVTFAVGSTSSSNTSTYASSSFTPAANDLIVVFVHVSGSTGANSTMSDSQGLGFTKITSGTLSRSSADSSYCFVSNSLAAASAMTVTFDCTGNNGTGADIDVYRVSGMSKTGITAVKQFAVQANHAAGIPAPAFSSSALTSNPVLGAVSNATSPAGLTPPTSWTEGNDSGYSTPTTGQESVWRNSGFTGTTVTWGSSSATAFASIIVELDSSVPNTAPTVALNTPTDTATGVSTTPDLVFTGTDADADTIEYNVQVDTAVGFDSQSTPTTYYLVMKRSGARDTTNYAGWLESATNVYAEGNSWRNNSGVWTSFAYDRVFTIYDETPTAKITQASGSSLNGEPQGGTGFLQEAGQSFTANSTFNLKYVDVNLYKQNSPTDNLTIEVRSAIDGSSLGTSNTVAMSGLSAGLNTAVRFTWATPVTLTATGPLLSKLSVTPDATFTDITNGADTDPFASADQIGYTVQAGDALTSGNTYYWRVRGKDPSGSNTYGAWATTRSFTTNASPTVALNTPTDTATGVSTTPDLLFTGTDANSNNIRYNVQIYNATTFGGSKWSLVNSYVATNSGTTVINVVTPPAAGDLLVMSISGSANSGLGRSWSFTSITQTGGSGAWTLVSNTNAGSSGVNTWTYLYYKIATSSDATNLSAVTVVNGGTSPGSTLLEYGQYSVGAAVSGLDIFAVSNGTGGTTSTANPISGSAQSANIDQLAISVVAGSAIGLPTGTNTFTGTTAAKNMAVANTTNQTTMVTKYVGGVQASATAGSNAWVDTWTGGSPFAKVSATFYYVGAVNPPLIDATSGTDAGFANTVTPANTDPFNTGEKVGYTVQAGNILAANTLYYWRARGIDPSGSNTYGAWATTRSFTTNASPTVALNTPADAGTVATTTPDLVFTGTDADSDTIEYNVQVDTVNTFDSLLTIKYIDVVMAKINSPTDNMSVDVRTTSITGTSLGTSDLLAASSISTTAAYVRFTFATPIVLSASTVYYFAISRSGSRDTTNRTVVYHNTGNLLTGGIQYVKASGTWSPNANSSVDTAFRVVNSSNTTIVEQSSYTLGNNTNLYGATGPSEEIGQSFTTTSSPLLDKLSVTPDATFTDVTNGADTHPFASADQIKYIVQAGNALTNGLTYYWRVRGTDPSGSNTYGAWATTRSFTVSSGTILTATQSAIARIATNRTATQPAIAKIAKTVTKTQPGVSRISNIVTKTQPATARISNVFTKTQAAIAKIAVTSTLAQPAISRIAKTVTKTQPSISRIAQILTKNQPAVARIVAILTKPQTAISRIATNPTKTQPVIARVANVRTVTQAAVANIIVNTIRTKTQAATARVALNLTKNQTALANIGLSRTKTQPATAKIATVLTKPQASIARVAIVLTKTQPAIARVATNPTKVQSAVARIVATPTKTQPAIARIVATPTKTQSAIANLLQSSVSTKTQPAIASISNIITKTQPATARIVATPTNAQTAVARISATLNKTQTAIARIAVIRSTGGPAGIDKMFDPGSGFNQSTFSGGSTYGETFISGGGVLDSATFRLAGFSSPVGTINVRIYNTTGSVGSLNTTGTPLAVSDNVNANTVSSFTLYTFTFSGANRISLTSGTTYAVMLEPNISAGEIDTLAVVNGYSGGNGISGSVGFGGTSSGTTDTIFYVYLASTPSQPATAHIKSIVTKTQPAISRVANTVTKTQSSIANIGAEIRYWVGNTGNWTDTAHWAVTSGGAGGASLPTSTTDVKFDASSFSTTSQIVTIPASVTASAKSIDMSGVSQTTTKLLFNTNSSVLNLYGNLTLGSNITVDYSGSFIGTINILAPATINTNGGLLNRTHITITMPNGTDVVQLGYSYANFASNFTIVKGTFNTNNYDFTPGNFQANHATNTTVINLGSSNVYTGASNTTNLFLLGSTSNITFNAGTSILHNNAGSSRTIDGGGKTFYDLVIDPSYSGSITTITGSNTFHSISSVNWSGYVNSFIFAAGTTQTITGAFSVSGTATNAASITSSTSGTPATISKASGIVSSDYLSIQDSTATGGATFYAGSHSTNVSGNTGWIFTAAPPITKTQSATARIAVTRTKTQGAITRIAKNLTKAQTATARISKTFIKTHTTSSNKKTSGLTKTHTTDLSKRQQFLKTHTTNSLLRRAVVVTHTTNSVLRRAINLTHTTSAFKHYGGLLSHTISSNKKLTSVKTHTTNTLKRQQFTKTHTTNSLLRRAITLTHTTNANLKKSGLTVSHTASANKKTAGLIRTHTTDALKRANNVRTHTTDILKRINTTKTHTTDSYIRSGFIIEHSTNTLKRRASVISHTTSSNKKKSSVTLTHTTNSNLRKSGVAVSHATNTVLRAINTRSHTTSSNKRIATVISHTTSANKKVAGFVLSHTTSLNKKVSGNTHTHTTSSLIRKANTLAHTTGSLLRRTIVKTHTTNSLLRSQATKTHTTSSNKRLPTTVFHTTSSNRKIRGFTRIHTTDTNKKVSSIVRTHTTNSLLRRVITLSHTTSSNIKKSGDIVIHTTSSFVRSGFVVIHRTDTNKKKSGNVITHTTSSILRRTVILSHTTGSLLHKANLHVHTTSSNLKKSGKTVLHTTSANKKLPTLVSHTTSLNKKLSGNTKTHTTDVNKKKTGLIKTHTTNSLLRVVHILIHTTSSNKKLSTNIKTHTISASKKIIGALTHTTSSNKKKSGKTVFHITSANLRKTGLMVSHTTSSALRKAYTVFNTTSVSIRKSTSIFHSTSANKKRAGTIFQTVSSILRKANVVNHATNALKRRGYFVSHTTNALLRDQYTTVGYTTSSVIRRSQQVSHTTSVMVSNSRIISHTTDATKWTRRGTKMVLVDGQWKYGIVEVLNGSEWVIVPVEYYDGSSWVLTQE